MRRATIRIMIYIGVVLTIWVGINMYTYTNSCLAEWCPGQSCFSSAQCYSGCVCAKKNYEVKGICASIDWEVLET